MKVDDSFKKPGSVPFKWEIRPGVPKLQSQLGRRQLEPGSEKQHQRKHKQTPPILKPPPAGLCFQPPKEPRIQTRSRSFRSSPSPRALSDRFGYPGHARPDVVSSAGCFPSPLAKLKIVNRDKCPRPIYESDYYSNLEVLSRRSVSIRKSVFPSWPSIPSYGSSPQPVFDADWAGFGLF